MGVDRERARRGAEAILLIYKNGDWPEWPSNLPPALANQVLGLLAELERVEAERDDARSASGKPLGFGPRDEGSSPSLATYSDVVAAGSDE